MNTHFVRCIEMYAIYFKPKQLNIFILISFNYYKNEELLKLEEIKFFKKEKVVINYLEDKKLELIQEQETPKHIIISNLIKSLNEYLSGKSLDLIEKIGELKIELDLNEKFPTPFSNSIIEIVKKLNRGEIITYSDIGNKIGSKAYRAIGNVLRNNPLPLIIPCHRVIKKSGDIGGFMGKIDQGWQQNLKKKLLAIERFKTF